MKIRNITFVWKKKEIDIIDYNNINKIEVSFKEGEAKPILLIDAGSIKIEDHSLPIDVNEVLKKIGEIDFERTSGLGYNEEFSGDVWQLVVNDKEYEGVLVQPHYVSKIRKIIRYNAIEVYAKKKIAGYIKA